MKKEKDVEKYSQALSLISVHIVKLNWVQVSKTNDLKIENNS